MKFYTKYFNMKRFILALLLMPQLLYAQYHANIFRIEASENLPKREIGKTYYRDTTIILDYNSVISGLSISGTAVLNNDNDSYIRVALVDDYNYEFLVYENYPALSDELVSSFDNVALETVLLDDVVPKSLRIELLNASLRLNSVNYSTTPKSRRLIAKKSSTIQKTQTQYIVDRLDENLKNRNMTWHAGVTSISEMSYSDKRDMFGGVVPKLYGFEHYAGGVFVMPGEYLNTPKTESVDDKYVKEWDWRNRHGKNWMTPVKKQEQCSSCWAHVAIGLTESYVNLYYNDTINYNLSEQELISCNSREYGCSGGDETGGLSYIRDYGVVTEDCFRYSATDEDCQNKCNMPSERIFIEARKALSFYLEEADSIKQLLFKCPIAFHVNWGHVMILAGYKMAQHGDVVYDGASTDHKHTIVIDSTSHADIIGRTIWLLKNSWGPNWGDKGYCHLIFNYKHLNSYTQIRGKITSQIYTDSDIICEDADGDGYYFWGLGPKPAHCPSWVPDTPDGDDSDINSGPMDDFGNLDILTPNGVTINTPISYDTNRVLSNRLGIVKDGALTITSDITMTDDTIIRVCENGKLIVDGGSIQNANLQLIPGCEVVLRNGGTINMANNCELNVPIGAVVTIKDGEIR